MGGEFFFLGVMRGGDGPLGGDSSLWGVWPSSGGWVGNYADRRTEFEKGQNLYCQLVWDFYPVDDLFPHSQENPALPSKNNPDTSGYFNMNFIPCLIALLITQSTHHEC